MAVRYLHPQTIDSKRVEIELVTLADIARCNLEEHRAQLEGGKCWLMRWGDISLIVSELALKMAYATPSISPRLVLRHAFTTFLQSTVR